jgi:hypothetical protein
MRTQEHLIYTYRKPTNVKVKVKFTLEQTTKAQGGVEVEL